MSKLALEPGMLCTFDKINSLKQKNSEISYVIVIKRINYRPFSKSRWLVKDAYGDKDSHAFSCPEYLLGPSNLMMMRYPENMPEFSDIDLTVIEGLIRRLENKGLLLYIAGEDKVYENHLKRLKAIYEKMKFYMEMRDL